MSFNSVGSIRSLNTTVKSVRVDEYSTVALVTLGAPTRSPAVSMLRLPAPPNVPDPSRTVPTLLFAAMAKVWVTFREPEIVPRTTMLPIALYPSAARSSLAPLVPPRRTRLLRLRRRTHRPDRTHCPGWHAGRNVRLCHIAAHAQAAYRRREGVCPIVRRPQEPVRSRVNSGENIATAQIAADLDLSDVPDR